MRNSCPNFLADSSLLLAPLEAPQQGLKRRSQNFGGGQKQGPHSDGFVIIHLHSSTRTSQLRLARSPGLACNSRERHAVVSLRRHFNSKKTGQMRELTLGMSDACHRTGSPTTIQWYGSSPPEWLFDFGGGPNAICQPPQMAHLRLPLKRK